MEREEELARSIVATPATQSWMIFDKIEVLTYYLTRHGGTNWADNREIMMLGGILADLRRFPPTDQEVV